MAQQTNNKKLNVIRILTNRNPHCMMKIINFIRVVGFQLNLVRLKNNDLKKVTCNFKI